MRDVIAFLCCAPHAPSSQPSLPQAVYFGAVDYEGSNVWTGPTGGYSGVVQRIGAGAVDWFNVQFYNANPLCYASYASIFFMVWHASSTEHRPLFMSQLAAAIPSFPAVVAAVHSLSWNSGR